MDGSLTLVLLRHGESVWNLQNTFTGWTDVPLSERGRDEAIASGQAMAADSINFDVAHTSVLARAIMTANYALDEMGLGWIPVKRHWRLNERHYGALQGLNKAETAERYGSEQVHLWRRSYSTAPPAVETTDDRHPSHDRRYRDLAPELLPATECLEDVIDRMLPYWFDAIVPDLLSGRSVLVAAHGNTLRALVKHLVGISDDRIADLNLPTGVPLVYELNRELEVVGSRFLGDVDAFSGAASMVANTRG